MIFRMKVRQMLALALGVLVFASTAAVAAASPGAEAEFVSAINQSRSAAGLAPLTVHGDLVAVARAHTAEMNGHDLPQHIRPAWFGDHGVVGPR